MTQDQVPIYDKSSFIIRKTEVDGPEVQNWIDN